MSSERSTAPRRRTLAASAVAVTLLTAGCAGGGNADGHDGHDGHDGAAVARAEDGRGPTTAEWIACSRTMAVGDVVSVRNSATKGHVVMAFDVTEWLKPPRGRQRITLDVVDPGTYDTQRRLRAGQRLLIAVPVRDDTELGVLQGDSVTLERGRIRKGLDAAESTPCPSP